MACPIAQAINLRPP